MAAAEPTLEVLDDRVTLAIGFADLVKYHGRSSVAGLALGFKALELALLLLAPREPARRREVEVQTAFDGPGSRDAFEMVTRAVTEDRYRVVPELAFPGAPQAPEGHFVFRLAYRGAVVDLVLRDGLVGEDFVELVRRGRRSPAEEEQLVEMKEAIAARLLAMPAEDVYRHELRHGPGAQGNG